MADDLMSIFRAAKILGVNVRTLYKAVESGHVPYRPIPVTKTRRLVRLSDVRAYLRDPPKPGPKSDE